jgi:hypothetical protein
LQGVVPGIAETQAPAFLDIVRTGVTFGKSPCLPKNLFKQQVNVLDLGDLKADVEIYS